MVFKLLEQAGIKIDLDDEPKKVQTAPQFDDDDENEIRIVIVGVGGSGNNTITRLYDLGVQGAELIAMNTDAQALKHAKAHKKLLLGKDLTQGKGSGGDPEVGYRAAEASAHEIAETIGDADLVFITAGMGNGTGTGAAPVVARVIKERARHNGRFREPLVISVVTYPFKNEGKIREEKAKAGIKALLYYSDTVVIIENDKLLQLVPKLPINAAFRFADEIIARMVKGITETIKLPSMVNIDFADVYSIMHNGGAALIGIGESDSSNRAVDAVKNALQNKLLDVEYGSGEKALVHFTVGPDVSLGEINEAMNIVYEKLGEKSEIKWGARIDEDMGKMVRAMVIMTGVKSPHILGGETALQLPVKESLLPAEPKAGFNSFEDKIYKVISRKSDEKPGSDMRGYINKLLADFDDLS
ncbi:cell division GTPase [Thermococcus kodakarensis KOD1]|uniref:Cell division protein FtsZ 2 n=1 Tax=Thermococcus kodakarensis (strain ATCC BAA-918 / JCM 12380 / KOD1) TaxID=69014 RepID=FTSZ2_THEKO|nr:cell division protein FtsZ [Thermococcus kodakarensis]Q9HHC9.1 RecName: Full=Cell division protein FtsZ 2 [Thermococcus kodakarensis KOD1]WCN28096.1 cell division protein FtsZ [Thermococcus kodakarensis]WCN30393.1 cell division protein FtsZ [Thermococcus kodakarensis]BAB17295.1 tubB [Thermococcus kodakarensis KOD1]BAD86460.1 cell division GTPase [Thermococcus kodakarensis KOD1]